MLGKKKKQEAADAKAKTAKLAAGAKSEAAHYETLRTKHGDYQTTLTEAYKNRKPWTAPNPKEVYSFIPGTILELSVAVGQEVKKGDKLLMFKAMKMDNTFLSPMDGVVGKIHCKVGDIVPKGQLLLEFK